MSSSLENKVALVTGGSRGIGRAIALEFAARGAVVVVNYNKSPEAAEEVVKKIKDAGAKALAREVAARNITVNAIAPGFVDTEILDAMTSETLEAAMKMVPLARKGKPEEIAYAAAFLASDEAAYITGQVLGVDGGMAMM